MTYIKFAESADINKYKQRSSTKDTQHIPEIHDFNQVSDSIKMGDETFGITERTSVPSVAQQKH